MRENRGLSLVELLITIAILSIVLAAATSFMITGSRSFAKGNADSELQKEAELTVNQVEDMIIDVNGGMNVSDDQTEVAMYHAEIVGVDTVHTGELVQWNQGEQKLYYAKWTPEFEESTGEDKARPAVADKLLAENVAAFEVELDTKDETALDGTVKTIVRSVQIRVGYENSNGRVDYATSPVITLRNRMLLSGNMAEIFEDFQAPSDTMKLWYNGPDTMGATVIIKDYESPVQRGSSYTVYARLNRGVDDSGTEIQGGDVSHLVNWEIETPNHKSTIDSSGYLWVAPTEPNDYLKITARYKNNPSKKASGIVKVIGGSTKSLVDVTIVPRWQDNETTDAYKPRFGSYPTLEGIWSIDEIAAIQYTWEIISGEEYLEGYTESRENTDVKYAILDLNIKNDPGFYGKSITFMLTAYSEYAPGGKVTDIYTYTIPVGGGDSNMKRGMGVPNEWGQGGHKNINYTAYCPLNDWPPIEVINYDCYFCNELGYRKGDEDALYGLNGSKRAIEITKNLKPSGHQIYYTLTFNENLPANQAFYVKVVLDVKQDVTQWVYDEKLGQSVETVVDTNYWSYERIHYIAAVSLYDRYEYDHDDQGNFWFYYGLVGYYDNSWGASDPMIAQYDVEVECDNGAKATASVVQDESRGVDRIWARGVITMEKGDLSDVKSISVRVSMAQHPEVYTYVNIYY